jgi:hypothetical protein
MNYRFLRTKFSGKHLDLKRMKQCKVLHNMEIYGLCRSHSIIKAKKSR